MDPQLLDYYNEELVYMRQVAGEFAAQHPKIAKRLGMQGIEVADPYVERLIEAFCFMSARTRIKLDAEFPRFTERLLEVTYPNYVSPTPSMSVAQLHPSEKEGDFRHGFPVPRGTSFFTRAPLGEETECEFRSSQDVMLWPVAITQAKLAGIPPDIRSLERYLPAHAQAKGSLRLRLRSTRQLKFADIVGLDRLPIYLCGDEQVASHLFELLHTAAVATFTGPVGKVGEQPHVVVEEALVHEGMAPEQSMLPLDWHTFHGHNLLHEYFACPNRFYFFALQHLAKGLSHIRDNEVEIVIVLSREPGELAGLVDEKQFALHCTPIINLFDKRTDRIEIDHAKTEFHVVPDRSRPLDFEVYSVTALLGQQADTTEEVVFRPLYQTRNQDDGNYGRYFSVRRERRQLSEAVDKHGARTPYVRTETFVSLVDQHEAPYPFKLRYLSVRAMLTNQDLPLLAPRNGVSDLRVTDSTPVQSVGLIRPVSPPKPPFAQRELAWRLIRQLAFNYLPLSALKGNDGARALRDMLRLFVEVDDVVALKQIEALIGSQITPVMRRLPGAGPLVYGRGVQCELTIDESGFSGVSPYIFGLVMSHYLARHVSVNVFAETQLRSEQRGLVAHWPARVGTRDVV